MVLVWGVEAPFPATTHAAASVTNWTSPTRREVPGGPTLIQWTHPSVVRRTPWSVQAQPVCGVNMRILSKNGAAAGVTDAAGVGAGVVTGVGFGVTAAFWRLARSPQNKQTATA